MFVVQNCICSLKVTNCLLTKPVQLTTEQHLIHLPIINSTNINGCAVCFGVRNIFKGSCACKSYFASKIYVTLIGSLIACFPMICFLGFTPSV